MDGRQTTRHHLFHDAHLDVSKTPGALLMATIIPFDQVGLHPDSRWSFDFDIGSWAAWEAILLADPNVVAISNDGGAVIDGTVPFNGHNSIRMAAAGGHVGAMVIWSAYLGPPYDEFYAAAWMRAFVWIGVGATFDEDAYWELPRLAGGGLDSWPNWNPAGSNADTAGHPFPPGLPEDSYLLDTVRGPPYEVTVGPMPYDTLKGQWSPVVVFGERIGTAHRSRMWGPDGALVIDVTWPTGGTAAFTQFILIMTGYTLSSSTIAIGQFDFHDGVAFPTPYCGLEGFPPCGGVFGGVTAYTHTFQNGTMRTLVTLGGKPKSSYKRWKPLTVKKPFPKLPVDLPPPTPIPPGGIVPFSLVEETTIHAASYTDTAIVMPAATTILGVSTLVTADIPGPTTAFSVGDSADVNRFQTANVPVSLGSTDPGTKAGAYYNATARAVRLSMIGGTPATSVGRVRVIISGFTVNFG